MLRKAEALYRHRLEAAQQQIGKVKDLYFDDRHWTVRYIVADTAGWLRERLVLISPYAVVSLDEEREVIVTSLTKEQIEGSPPAESDAPVSRQFEVEYHDYYGWPWYWVGLPFAWGTYPAPVPAREPARQVDELSWDSRLRSTREVDGYGVEASDGGIGHVADFIVDDETWTIRYLVIDTRSWWPNKHVLMSPEWVDFVSWDDREVRVSLARDAIKGAPEYTRDSLVTRDYEMELSRHYGRHGYWTEGGRA